MENEWQEKGKLPAVVNEGQLSGDVYEAIEQFSGICSACKAATGRRYEAGDHAYIQITQKGNCTRLEMACRARGLSMALPAVYAWLAAENNQNEIHYASENITGYQVENHISGIPAERNAVFCAYKKGNARAVGEALQVQERDGVHTLAMLIHFQ